MADKKSSMQIERARPDDGPAVLELLTRCSLPTDGFIEHLETAVVARDRGRVVGSAALELYPDGALLRSVAVDSSLRGHGVGHQVTEAALDLARARGVPAVYLLTTTADAFFPKLGFHRIEREHVPVGVRDSVEFTSACPASAVAMKRTLTY